MAEDQTQPNLLSSSAPATRLPGDPAIAELADHGREDFLSVVRSHPASSLCWALLAEGSLLAGTESSDIAAYAYARTGYHRGLDALRKAGWRGQGPIPWGHLPNQGFLRCLWALSVAAGRIGEDAEARRYERFLRQSSEAAWQELHTTLVTDGHDGLADDLPGGAESTPGAGDTRDDEDKPPVEADEDGGVEQDEKDGAEPSRPS